MPYDKKLPAESTKNDIRLTREPISFGIPDGTQLSAAIRILAGKLNVTVVFSSGCSKKAVSTSLNGRELQGDPRIPERILKDLITQVKDPSLRFDVINVEEGRRYEVRCY